MAKHIEVMESQCRTCPFRKDGWTEVRPLLEDRALNIATPICHSTGSNALVGKKKKASGKRLLCRGARNFQLMLFHRMGLLAAPTDEAWEAKRLEMGI